jgi:D-sedoheptulose 7-phosphate isomerase
VHVPAEKGEYGPAEDGHMVLDHLVGSYLKLLVKEEKPS